jgi:hypothetical protein
MAFKQLCVILVKNADKNKFSLLDTGNFHQYSVAVKNNTEAIELCLKFIREKNINAIMLCPGFTNIDVAEIDKATGNEVSVCVARNDNGPATFVTVKALQKEGIM